MIDTASKYLKRRHPFKYLQTCLSKVLSYLAESEESLLLRHLTVWYIANIEPVDYHSRTCNVQRLLRNLIEQTCPASSTKVPNVSNSCPAKEQGKGGIRMERLIDYWMSFIYVAVRSNAPSFEALSTLTHRKGESNEPRVSTKQKSLHIRSPIVIGPVPLHQSWTQSHPQ